MSHNSLLVFIFNFIVKVKTKHLREIHQLFQIAAINTFDFFACHVLKIYFIIRVEIKYHYIVMHNVISDGKMKSLNMFLILKKISK